MDGGMKVHCRPGFPFLIPTEADQMNEVSQNLPTEAVAALEHGSKIEAIKYVRVANGVGLKDAKEIVEQFIDENPEVKRRMSSANAESARNSLGWTLLLAAIGAALYYFLAGKP